MLAQSIIKACPFTRNRANSVTNCSTVWCSETWFRGSRVNERRIRASFCPFKNLSGHAKM